MPRRSSRLAAKPRVDYRKMAGKRASRPVQLSKPVTAAVKRIVKGTQETKMVSWFGSPLYDGVWTTTGITPQNGFITSNATDLLRIIPYVPQGLGDNERVGQSITPVSMRIHCKVLLTPTLQGGSGVNNGYSYNVTCIAYCLQHVSLKTYQALAARNDFTQLLQIGNGSTVGFSGKYEYSTLPVESGYYRVLKVKKINLRSSGNTLPGGSPANVASNNNSHQTTHEWVWDITKAIPKRLTFPENTAPPAGLNDPLNAAPFWCVGYYNMDNTPNTQPTQVFQQYSAFLKYKDA